MPRTTSRVGAEIVVVERDVLVRHRDALAIDAVNTNDSHNSAVIGDDRIGIAVVVDVGCTEVRIVVAANAAGRAAKDQVAAVRTQVGAAAGRMIGCIRLKKSELPPMMSSWPRLPRRISSPPLPSM